MGVYPQGLFLCPTLINDLFFSMNTDCRNDKDDILLPTVCRGVAKLVKASDFDSDIGGSNPSTPAIWVCRDKAL